MQDVAYSLVRRARLEIKSVRDFMFKSQRFYLFDQGDLFVDNEVKGIYITCTVFLSSSELSKNR